MVERLFAKLKCAEEHIQCVQATIASIQTESRESVGFLERCRKLFEDAVIARQELNVQEEMLAASLGNALQAIKYGHRVEVKGYTLFMFGPSHLRYVTPEGAKRDIYHGWKGFVSFTKKHDLLWEFYQEALSIIEKHIESASFDTSHEEEVERYIYVVEKVSELRNSVLV